MANPNHEYANTTSSVDLTSFVEIVNWTNSAAHIVVVSVTGKIGDDVSDSLDGSSETTITVRVLVGSVAMQELEITVPASQTSIAFATAPIPVMAGDALQVYLKSSNGSDSLVAVDRIVFSEAGLQPGTVDRTLDVDANGDVGLTSAERDAISAAVEAVFVDEGDATATLAAIAAAVRDVVLNRVLAGNHDTTGTIGEILQTLDTLVTSARMSKLDVAGTLAHSGAAATYKADVSLITSARMSKLDVSGTLAHSDDADTYKADVSGLSGSEGGGSSVDTDLLNSLLSQLNLLLPKLENVNNSIARATDVAVRLQPTETTVEPLTLSVGQRVVITGGIYTGREGTIAGSVGTSEYIIRFNNGKTVGVSARYVVANNA